MKTKIHSVYILSNKNLSVLYTGVTNNLVNRVFQHKIKLNKGFTANTTAACFFITRSFTMSEKQYIAKNKSSDIDESGKRILSASKTRIGAI